MKAYIITYAEGKHCLIAADLMGFRTGLFGDDATYIEVNCFTDEELQAEVDKRVREREEINLKAIHELQDYLKQANQRLQAERKRVIEEVRKWAKDYCRNNGDYSAVGAINDILEFLTKLEAGAK